MSWDESADYSTDVVVPKWNFGKLIAVPGGSGPPGPKGDTGDVGPQGEVGPVGPSGNMATFASLSVFPAAGDSANLYVAEDTGDSYRWDGAKYVRISERVPAVGIEDSTVVGRALVTATDERAGRTAIVAERHRTFNVLDYGAVADGVTDCRAAIHAARDAAGPGGTVFFPKGTYRVVPVGNTAPDYKGYAGGLHANVAGQTWELGSAELVLASHANSVENLITVSAPDVSIIGGTLDLSAVPNDPGGARRSMGIAVWSGNVGTGLNYGPHGSGAAGAVIDGVTVKDAPHYGVWANNTDSVTIRNCHVRDAFWAGIFVSNYGDQNIRDLVIDKNRVVSKYRSYSFGIYVGANDSNTGAGYSTGVRRILKARITNNYCELPRGVEPGQNSFLVGGRESAAMLVANTEDSVISGNVIEGGQYAISTILLRRVVISNNSCRGWAGLGIETSGAHESVTVIGNTLDSDGAGGPYNIETGLQDPNGTLFTQCSGVLSSLGAAVKNYAVVGNVITGFTTPAVARGVQLFAYAEPTVLTGVTICGNSILGTSGVTDIGTGCRFYGIDVTAAVTNMTISGNTIEGANRSFAVGVAVYGKTQTGWSITGNNFANLGWAAFYMGIGSDGVFSEFHFRGNLTRNCALVLRGDTSAVTRFFHDVGQIRDVNGKVVAELPAGTNAVNYFQLRNAPTGVPVTMNATGTDTDVSLDLKPKGTGTVRVNGTQVETKGHTHTVAQVTGAAQWVSVPASAAATGTAGQLAADAAGTFLYVCVAANTWRRVALTAW